MAKETSSKRPLKFNNFDEVIADVRSLQNSGYETTASWNLGQTCSHLADWIRYPMDGFPKPPFFMRPVFWFIKMTMAKSMTRKILAEGFKGDIPTAPESVHDADALTDEQAVNDFVKTIERAKDFDGELIPSPIFGPIDHETWMKVNLLHAEHHLGYLQPK